MNAIERIKGLLRRKPLTEDDLRAREEARLAGDAVRGLKSSQLSGVGEYDASARGGRGTY